MPIRPLKKQRKQRSGFFLLIGRCLDGIDAVFTFFSSTTHEDVVVVYGEDTDDDDPPNLRLIHGRKTLSNHGPRL